MKREKIKSSILSGIISLLLLFAPWWQSGKLTDITKPYLGEYECTQAYLGEEDCLEKFSYIILELKDKGDFTLSFCEKGDKKHTVKGKYQYDKEKEEITFLVKTPRRLKRSFPLQEGQISLIIPFGEKNLVLTFEQK